MTKERQALLKERLSKTTKAARINGQPLLFLIRLNTTSPLRIHTIYWQNTAYYPLFCTDLLKSTLQN
jgi:hypothetical protein